MDYQTFSFPDFIDAKTLIIWIAGSVIVVFGLIFWRWYETKASYLPKIALWLSILGLISLPVVYYGSEIYNVGQMEESVAANYDASVTQSLDRFNFIAAVGGDIHVCEVGTKNQKDYYVLCDVEGGRVYMETLKTGDK